MLHMQQLPTLPRECLAAGVSGAIADGLYNPATVLMVRGQLAPTLSTSQLVRRAVGRDGIFNGLWKPGLSSICLRALTYSGFRVGMYPTVRDIVPGDGFSAKLVAGCATGAVGAATFMPAEMARVKTVAAHGRGPYATLRGAVATTVREESATGLWRGATAFAARCGCFSGVQLATYETTKRWCLSAGVVADEGPKLHILASLVSGICGQIVSHPLDTVKTLRVMQPGHQTSTLEVAHELIAEGGVRRLYAGLLPAIVSRGPMVMTFLPLTELIRSRVFGLGYI